MSVTCLQLLRARSILSYDSTNLAVCVFAWFLQSDNHPCGVCHFPIVSRRLRENAYNLREVSQISFATSPGPRGTGSSDHGLLHDFPSTKARGDVGKKGNGPTNRHELCCGPLGCCGPPAKSFTSCGLSGEHPATSPKKLRSKDPLPDSSQAQGVKVQGGLLVPRSQELHLGDLHLVPMPAPTAVFGWADESGLLKGLISISTQNTL